MTLHALLARSSTCQTSQLTVRRKMQQRIGAQTFRLSSEGDRVDTVQRASSRSSGKWITDWKAQVSLVSQRGSSTWELAKSLLHDLGQYTVLFHLYTILTGERFLFSPPYKGRNQSLDIGVFAQSLKTQWEGKSGLKPRSVCLHSPYS